MIQEAKEYVCERVHSDGCYDLFLKAVQNAKVWEPSTIFDGVVVGAKRELHDGDIVRIYTKLT